MRWGEEPHCPHCGGVNVARKNEGRHVGRWPCHGCRSGFDVLSGAIFRKNELPLQKRFMAIGVTVNAKKSVSGHRPARDLDLDRKTAWHMQQRIRAAMAEDRAPLPQGIVEADETCVGGSAEGRRTEDREPAPRGRGTSKTPIIGAAGRGGKVVARMATGLSGRGVLHILQDTIDPAGTLLIADEYRAYAAAARSGFAHAVIDRSVACADGDTRTNAIEGFRALAKRARYGSHRHYSRHWTPLFVAEASWKYNRRKDENAFGSFLRRAFS